jgi:hypothetical protein
MPEHVINRVEAITTRDKQSRDTVFTGRDDNPIGNDGNDDGALNIITDTTITGVDIDGNNATLEEEPQDSVHSGTMDNGPGILLEPNAHNEGLFRETPAVEII